MTEIKVEKGAEAKQKSPNDTTQAEQQDIIKPTKKRYFILIIYVILTSIKSFQWICLASITNVVAKFYNVDNLAVNWTTVIFMITFLTLALPVNFIMEKIGLRRSLLIGSIGVSVGLIIKCFSVQPDRFWLTIIGHIVIGVVEPFFYSTYSQLAFAWFPDNQVAIATATGIIGDSLGIALGFLIPGLMVGSDINDNERIQWGMQTLFVTMTIVCSINTVLIILFFDEKPKHAPGIARFKQLEMESLAKQQRTEEGSSGEKSLISFMKILREFYTDLNFNLHQIGFGFNMGAGYALHTLLNQVVSGNEGKETDFENPILVTGNVGMILLVAGIFGSMVCGFLLDKFHAYKSTTNISYLLSLLLMVAFTLSLPLRSPTALYLISVPLGISLTSYTCCGYEFAVEMTYPRSELVSSTLLNISAQVFGIAITFIGSHVTDVYGSISGCWVLCGSIAIGLIVSCMVSPRYNRQKVVNESSPQPLQIKQQQQKSLQQKVYQTFP